MARNRGIRVRMTDEEFDLLADYAELFGITKSDLIRKGISAFINNRWYPYPKFKPRWSGAYIITCIMEYGGQELRFVNASAVYDLNRSEFSIEVGDGGMKKWIEAENVVAWMEFPQAYYAEDRLEVMSL